MEGFEWLRELEQHTKNSMAKVNGKAKSDALRRAGTDLSIHKWAQSLPAPGSRLGTDSPMAMASEYAPARARRRKRPLSAEGADHSVESGTRCERFASCVLVLDIRLVLPSWPETHHLGFT
jgi:hypothetical protein